MDLRTWYFILCTNLRIEQRPAQGPLRISAATVQVATGVDINHEREIGHLSTCQTAPSTILFIEFHLDQGNETLHLLYSCFRLQNVGGVELE